jgi:hypothetical protein
MKYVLVAMLVVVLATAVVSVYAQKACPTGNIASLCAREKGLCGLETRALAKGSVLLGYTRDKGTCPTALHIHVFKLADTTDKAARVKAYIYSPGHPNSGEKLSLKREGRGEYKTPIKWDTSKPMEMAVSVKRRGMATETVYFKLEPGIAPETK